MGDECKECKHEKKFHAIPEKHILNTAHCTKTGCNCKAYIFDV